MSAASATPLGGGVGIPASPERPAATPEPGPPPADRPAAAPEVVLDVRDLRTYFFTYEGVVRALDGVTFQLRRGETTGLVGETGCGKSVTAFSITRLVPDPPGRIVGGHVVLQGTDLLQGLDIEARFRPVKGTNRVRVSRRFRRILRANERMEAVRGRRIAMIFQEPTQALNPVFSIANQVGEILFLHRGGEIVDEMLSATPDAEEVSPAIEGLIQAMVDQRPDGLRHAADDLGRAAHSSLIGTEAFYIAQAGGSAPDVRRRLEHALARLRLSRLQRKYLLHRRRLFELRQRTNRARLAELRRDPTAAQARRGVRTRTTVERLMHLYFGLWGLRGWVRRPLDRALLWRVVRLLEEVRIADAPHVAQGYPHELSGGMIQRVMIAMALSGEPDILLADEPTTALDVTIQAQILELLDALRKRVGTAILLITHDLAVVAEVADRVCVMYAGQIVEQAPVRELFYRPLHPYTQGLLASLPRIDQPGKSLHTIAGSVPGLIDPPTGCRFHPRCEHAMPVCRGKRPTVTDEGGDHTVACYLYHGAPLGG